MNKTNITAITIASVIIFLLFILGLNYGYIGMVILVFGFALLNTTRYSQLYLPLNLIASVFFVIHSLTIKDIPFIIVNGLIIIFIGLKLYKEGVKQI